MIEIKSRLDSSMVLYRSESATTVREAVLEAVAAGANLARANLARADLADANLADAYLARAYLARANLARAYLARANLAGADLAGADLARADLADADLAGANLADANLADAYLARAYLAGANLAGADLAGADLARADLADADLAGANLADAYLARADLARAYLAGARHAPALDLTSDPPEPYKRATTPEESRQRAADRARRYREKHPEVPAIDQLDRRILEVIESGRGVLNMSDWHHGNACGTTHCRAGWAINLAGPAGLELEKEHGPQRAGAMIYRASTGRVPHFFATTERALEDIKRCAGEAEEP